MEATQAIPIFLALEPDEAAGELLWRYKRRVRELVGDQLYLDHPPHMTCYMAAFADAADVVRSTRRLAMELTAPSVSVTGWHTFLADPLTGQNTLVLDFTDADRERLRQLQSHMVESLSPRRDETASLERINGRWMNLSLAERDAAQRYGFPYIGRGWHPHLTVASIRQTDWPVVERELLREAPAFALTCPRIQLYRLIDDEPDLLEVFELPQGFMSIPNPPPPSAGEGLGEGVLQFGDRCLTSNGKSLGAAFRSDHSHPAERVLKVENEPVLGATGSASAAYANANTLAEPVAPELQNTFSETQTLKDELIAAMWSVVDRHDWILSATVTGSFLTDETLAAISDIDLVVIVEELTGPRFDGLQQEFTAALEPPLDKRGLKLRINPTLGPRKLNDDATAVLHLMLYSREAHHQHAIKSPFTCLDWQRSSVYRTRSMAEIYPVFGLQPHHFVSARRGIRDYLHDFEQGVVSYREIECSTYGCSETKRQEPMTTRDRYEYAYHVMRFLMQNLLKLVRRSNCVCNGSKLVEDYTTVFPHAAHEYAELYRELRWRKARRDFSTPIPKLGERLCNFVLDFESQFRVVFHESATRHVFFRHAPTPLNHVNAGGRRFLGRSDPGIEPTTAEQLAELIEAVTDFAADRVYVSPLRRCRQTLEQLNHHVTLPAPIEDARLLEIDYGACEGLSIEEARREHAHLFDEWRIGHDPPFPGGESTADVRQRSRDFLSSLGAGSGDPRTARSGAPRTASGGNSVVCTHNVVLRCLVGEGLGVPPAQWHRIDVPHLAPITVVQTRDYGWFVDLEEPVERRLFANFLYPAQEQP